MTKHKASTLTPREKQLYYLGWRDACRMFLKKRKPGTTAEQLVKQKYATVTEALRQLHEEESK